MFPGAQNAYGTARTSLHETGQRITLAIPIHVDMTSRTGVEVEVAVAVANDDDDDDDNDNDIAASKALVLRWLKSVQGVCLPLLDGLSASGFSKAFAELTRPAFMFGSDVAACAYPSISTPTPMSIALNAFSGLSTFGAFSKIPDLPATCAYEFMEYHVRREKLVRKLIDALKSPDICDGLPWSWSSSSPSPPPPPPYCNSFVSVSVSMKTGGEQGEQGVQNEQGEHGVSVPSVVVHRAPDAEKLADKRSTPAYVLRIADASPAGVTVSTDGHDAGLYCVASRALNGYMTLALMFMWEGKRACRHALKTPTSCCWICSPPVPLSDLRIARGGSSAAYTDISAAIGALVMLALRHPVGHPLGHRERERDHDRDREDEHEHEHDYGDVYFYRAGPCDVPAYGSAIAHVRYDGGVAATDALKNVLRTAASHGVFLTAMWDLRHMRAYSLHYDSWYDYVCFAEPRHALPRLQSVLPIAIAIAMPMSMSMSMSMSNTTRTSTRMGVSADEWLKAVMTLIEHHEFACTKRTLGTILRDAILKSSVWHTGHTGLTGFTGFTGFTAPVRPLMSSSSSSSSSSSRPGPVVSRVALVDKDENPA